MPKTLKEDALETARLLLECERAGDGADVTGLHLHLRASLYRHRRKLGLSDDDVREIDNAGFEAFGGTPKEPAPEEP